MSTIHRLRSDGQELHDLPLATVLAASRAAGLSAVLIDVLADPTEPAVVRLRAYGRLSAALDGRGRRAEPTLRPAA